MGPEFRELPECGHGGSEPGAGVLEHLHLEVGTDPGRLDAELRAKALLLYPEIPTALS